MLKQIFKSILYLTCTLFLFIAIWIIGGVYYERAEQYEIELDISIEIDENYSEKIINSTCSLAKKYVGEVPLYESREIRNSEDKLIARVYTFMKKNIIADFFLIDEGGNYTIVDIYYDIQKNKVLSVSFFEGNTQGYVTPFL